MNCQDVHKLQQVRIQFYTQVVHRQRFNLGSCSFSVSTAKALQPSAEEEEAPLKSGSLGAVPPEQSHAPLPYAPSCLPSVHREPLLPQQGILSHYEGPKCFHHTPCSFPPHSQINKHGYLVSNDSRPRSSKRYVKGWGSWETAKSDCLSLC